MSGKLSSPTCTSSRTSAVPLGPPLVHVLISLPFVMQTSIPLRGVCRPLPKPTQGVPTTGELVISVDRGRLEIN
jgi:hypothetical protein